MARPTETSVTQAASAVITALGLASKIVPRWLLGLSAGEAVSHLAPVDGGGLLLDINSWNLSISAWVPAKVKAADGKNPTPQNFAFTPGFDDAPGMISDLALAIDYKIIVQGTLKVWQLVQYRQGSDTDNSEIDSQVQRQQVIDAFSGSPRFGQDSPDFSHDELKFPAITTIPFNDNYVHVAQGNIPFSFSYVVSAA